MQTGPTVQDRATRGGNAWGAGLVAAALLFGAALLGLNVLRDVAAAQAWVTHTMEVQLQAERLRTDLRGLGRSVLDSLVSRPAEPASVSTWRQRLADDMNGLSSLVKDNPEQSARAARLHSDVAAHLDRVERLRPGDAVGLALRRQRAAEIEQSIADFQAVEASLLQQRRRVLERDLRLHTAAVLALGVVSLALIAVAAALAVRLLRSKAQAEAAVERARALASAHQRVQFLARQLLQVEESERRMLAHELHDDLAQRLAALKLNLQLARQADGESDGTLGIAIDIADQCIAQVRQRAVTLRPQQLDELGLASALAAHVQEQARLTGVQGHVEVELEGWKRTPEWEGHVFRIVQEAVRNALHHGRPRSVRVALRSRAGACDLTVEDDGCGVTGQPKAGLGLLHMRERAEMLGGSFELSSRAEGGTRVACHWETER